MPELVRVLAFVIITSTTAAACAPASQQTAAETRPAIARRADATIAIAPNSPAETVRIFYKYLREKKFREAIFLTNLRPAVEGLTDAELKEFQLDFERIAVNVPADIQINGEIISGDTAMVTANLPTNDDLDASQVQEIKLRRDNGVWVVLTVDDAAEAKIREEGNNYFYALKIESHQDDAREMLERISKAQMAFAAANKGRYAEIGELVRDELLAKDVTTSESTGYNYSVNVFDNGRKYSATATPAVYGKTGRLTFSITLDKKDQPHLTSKDMGGK